MDLTDGTFLRREFARLNARLDGIEATLQTITTALGDSAAVPEVDDAVRELLRSGLKLQAVKAYQKQAGVDLATADAFIQQWGERIVRDERSSSQG